MKMKDEDKVWSMEYKYEVWSIYKYEYYGITLTLTSVMLLST